MTRELSDFRDSLLLLQCFIFTKQTIIGGKEKKIRKNNDFSNVFNDVYYIHFF